MYIRRHNANSSRPKAILTSSGGADPGSFEPEPMTKPMPKLKLRRVLRHHRSNLRLSIVSCSNAQLMYGMFLSGTRKLANKMKGAPSRGIELTQGRIVIPAQYFCRERFHANLFGLVQAPVQALYKYRLIRKHALRNVMLMADSTSAIAQRSSPATGDARLSFHVRLQTDDNCGSFEFLPLRRAQRPVAQDDNP